MRFFSGDELGNLKILQPKTPSPDITSELLILRTGNAEIGGVQALSTRNDPGSISTLLAAGYSNGAAGLLNIAEDNTITHTQKWTETRLKPGQRYIGIHCAEKNVFSCTSNGALRSISIEQNPSDNPTSFTGLLPTRLCDWRLFEDQNTFAYGGDEVELSVWNTERAFQNQVEDLTSSSKNRKRNDTLFPGEIWRAKNVSNDNLGLRQPVRITSLCYLSSSSQSSNHLVTGTQLGSVRRYDTRTARKPVSDWRTAKVGGVEALEQGFNQHEIFVSDSGSNLSALDLRNGRVLYSYKGLAGAVSSIAPSPTLMVSVAKDRYCRVHSVFPAPDQPGERQEHRGEVLEKIYTKSIPTVVVWDRSSTQKALLKGSEEIDKDSDEDIWDNMQDVDDDGE
ncbi:WD40-repeat-containing domain protein [Lentinula raphanica]|nr:WD40-repeat-containing domain protein [Lentinula raphanica]